LSSPAGIGSAVIVLTPLALATYALRALAIAGRGTVDLSIGPLMGFINVTLVVLSGMGALESPVSFFLYAIAVGVAYQLLMALIIVYVRVQPIIVALSGYLALSGINLVILPRPGGTAPEWMSSWGLGTTLDSPILVILVLSTAAWLVFTSTAFYGHLRLMGSDERAAYTSGVRITIVRLGAHCIAGVFAALAALTYTALIGSGDPTQGTTYTLIAVTALVLGGTSLAGGRGGVIGSLLGAVNLFLIGYVLAAVLALVALNHFAGYVPFTPQWSAKRAEARADRLEGQVSTLEREATGNAEIGQAVERHYEREVIYRDIQSQADRDARTAPDADTPLPDERLARHLRNDERVCDGASFTCAALDAPIGGVGAVPTDDASG
jgi:ribose/xylose/arabinose/galactoside ABC-type transport system permease subunit